MRKKEFPAGERDNARKDARCMQAKWTTQGLDGQHHDVDRQGRIHGLKCGGRIMASARNKGAEGSWVCDF